MMVPLDNVNFVDPSKKWNTFDLASHQIIFIKKFVYPTFLYYSFKVKECITRLTSGGILNNTCLYKRSLFCFSIRSNRNTRSEWLSNFTFLNYCTSTTNISGNVGRVFSIISSSIMTWLHNLNCNIIWYSSLLKETSVEKSNTHKWVQSWQALGRKMVFWWSNQDLSLCQSSYGFSSFRY